MSRCIRCLGALAGGLLLLALPALAEPSPPYLYGPPTSPTVVRVGFHLTDISDVDEREESVAHGRFLAPRIPMTPSR